MTQIVRRSVLAAAMSVIASGAVLAQPAAVPRNDRIVIDYQEPFDPEGFYGANPADTDDRTKLIYAEYKAFGVIKQRLQQLKVLERFAQFLVPLKLPTTLRLIARQCDTPNAFFQPRDISITLCYDYVKQLEDQAPRETNSDGITRADAIIGAVVATLLHETGHALFYLYKIPVLGREEDAADQIAAYVALQFGDDVALTTIKGQLWEWYNWSVPVSKTASSSTVLQNLYADVHSTSQQRFVIFLCLGYGGKPQLFQSFINAGHLHPSRAATCRRDYEQAERAFVKTVLPHIDRDMMAIVRSAKWFYPEDKGTIPVQTR